MNTGILVIISSPSGGGKDTVINALQKRFANTGRLVTTTTRPPRPGNKEGVDYYFVDEATFKERLAQEAFLEYNNYAGYYYGEEKQEVNKCLSQFSVTFTQIDVTGKHALDKLNFPHLAIFLVPESLAVLKERIEKRGGITPEKIAERLTIAEHEIAASSDYDYRVLNKENDLPNTIETVAQIIENHLKKGSTIDKKDQIY